MIQIQILELLAGCSKGNLIHYRKLTAFPASASFALLTEGIWMFLIQIILPHELFSCFYIFVSYFIHTHGKETFLQC